MPRDLCIPGTSLSQDCLNPLAQHSAKDTREGHGYRTLAQTFSSQPSFPGTSYTVTFTINTCLNLLVALNPRDPQSSKLLVPLGEPKKAGWEQLLQTSALLTVHLALGFSPTAPH